ncbi:MAG: hypothetical protein IPG32_04535 [Saprospirales bacterium]|nr:hypothetical protein [Saprospirales bacterium]
MLSFLPPQQPGARRDGDSQHYHGDDQHVQARARNVNAIAEGYLTAGSIFPL